MTKSKPIAFIFFLFIFLMSFCFVGCGPTKNSTDDGSLDHEASFDTQMQYNIDDFNTVLGEQSTQEFSGFDGFRFTYVLIEGQDQNITVKRINGLATNEGMNFELFINSSGSFERSEIITLKQQKLYIRQNNVTDTSQAPTKTYSQTSQTKFEVLTNYLNELEFTKLYLTPQSILDNLNNENVSVSVIKHETTFMLNLTENSTFVASIYVNFDKNNKLTAIKYQSLNGSEQFTLSGFNGTIAFPDLSSYVAE